MSRDCVGHPPTKIIVSGFPAGPKITLLVGFLGMATDTSAACAMVKSRYIYIDNGHPTFERESL